MTRETPRVGDVWRQSKAYELSSSYILIVPGKDFMRVMNLETGEVYGALTEDTDMFPWKLFTEIE